MTLWNKYIKSGLSPLQAEERLDKFIIYLNNLAFTLKLENKSKEDINKKFKEEFWQLCQKLET